MMHQVRPLRRRLALSTALAGGALVLAQGAFAQTLPTGPSVGAGNPDINPSANAVDIGLNDARTIINWTSFNIGSGKSVNFTDTTTTPGDSPLAVLNRDLSGNMSQIDGALTASSNIAVYVINTNGITFGAGANVNVGALIASSLDLADADFTDANANLHFSGPGAATAGITVAGGSLATTGVFADGLGQLVLIGAYVDAQGGSQTASGNAAFIAGTDVSMTAAAGSPLSFTITRGTSLSNAITANGTVAGRNVTLAFATQDSVMDALLSVGGVVTATTASATDRGIVLAAGTDGSGITLGAPEDTAGAAAVEVSGTLTASQTAPANTANALIGARDGVAISGDIGADDNVTVTNINQKIDFDGGSITAGNNASLLADVTLAGSATIEATAGQANFSGAVEGPGVLEVTTGTGTIFGGGVGAATALQSVAITGATTVNGSGVRTTGSQSYDGALALGGGGASKTFTSTGDDTIAFNGAVDGAYAVAVHTNGAATFGGAVGGATPLTSLSTDAATAINGGSIITTGDQTYGGTITLGGSTILSGATPSFAGGVTGAGFDLALNFSGTTAIDAGFTGIRNLSTGGGGTTTLTGTITTGGTQTYNDAVTLAGNTVLASNGAGAAGNIGFGSTVDAAADGAQSLAVNTSGTTSFGGLVGGTAAGTTKLASLTTDAGGDTAINGSGVTTTGTQNYNDAVTLGGAGAGRSFTSTSGAAIGFGSTLSGGYAVAVHTTGTTTFGGAVGGTPLTSLSTDGALAINGGSIATSGDQTYGGTVTLGAGTTLSGATPSFAAGGVTGGGFDLALNFSGTTAITGNFAGIRNLSTGAAGTTTLTGAITTSGTQTYNDAVTLAGNTTLTSNGVGVTGNIGFGSTVDAAANGVQSLTVNTDGTTSFGGLVGGTAAGTTKLASLVTNANGSTAINGGGVTTTGNQTYGDGVTLGANATLTGTTPGFSGAGVNGGGFDLALNFSGTTAIDGTFIGIANLSTGGGGTTSLSGGITTAGNQSYGDAVSLAANVTLTGQTPTFSNGVTGNGNDLALNFAGTTAIDGTFTGINNLSSGGGGTTTLAGSINTGGNQTYGDAVSLAANTILSGATPTFSNGVTGNGFDLTLNFSGTTTITGAFTGIDDLATGGGGTTALLGTIATTGAQTYNDAVALAADTTLSGTTPTFAAGINGNDSNLTLSFSGTTAIDGDIANIHDLSSGGGGTTTLSGTITTSGSQIYSDTVTLNGNTVIAAGASGVGFGTINSATNGGQSLTITTAGTASFGGAVGGAVPATSTTRLASLNVTAGAILLGAGSVTTTGNQSYGGQLLLTSGATLTGATPSFAGSGVVGNGFDLALNFSGTTAITSAFTGIRDLSTGGGGTTTLTGTIATGRNQSYGDAVSLVGNTTLSGATPTFSNGVTGNGFDLALNFSGTTAINGTFTGIEDLSSAGGGTTTLSGTIATTGNQSYGDAVSLAGNTTLSGATPTFSNGVTGNGFDLALNFSGTTAVNETFTGIHDLSTGGGGATTLTGSIATSGTQTYSDAVTLAGDTALSSSGVGALGNIGFGTTIAAAADGGQSLSVITDGSAGFAGAVGTPGAALALLGVRADSASFGGTNRVATLAVDIDAGGLSFTNAQALSVGAYSGITGITVDAGGVALATTVGNLSIANDIAATGQTVSLVSSGSIAESGGTISAATLTGSASGAATFNGINLVSNLGAFSASGFSFSNGQSLTVTGAVNGGAGNVTIAVTGNLGFNSATGSASAGADLILSATGSLSAEDLSAGGDASLTAGTLLTLGNGVTMGDDLSLTAADFAGVALTQPFAPGTGDDLIITDTNGGLTLSGALSVPGTLTVNVQNGGGLVVSGSIQSQNENILLATAGGGAMAFSGNVTTGAGASVTLNATGAISQSSGAITTGLLTGQSVGGISLTRTTNAIAQVGPFTNTVGGGFALASNSALTVVGPIVPAGDLSISAQGLTFTGQPLSGVNVTLNANGGALVGNSATATGGNLILGGATIDVDTSSATGSFAANGAFSVTGATSVSAGTQATFAGTVNGSGALTVTAPGGTTFQGNVGTGIRLASLSVNGATTLAASSILTNGLNVDALTVAAGAPSPVRLSGGTGALVAGGPITAAAAGKALALDGASISVGDVGVGGAFQSVSFDDPTTLSGNVVATGAVAFTDPLSLTGSGVRKVAGGSASFQQVTTAATNTAGLSVDVTGNASFAGPLGIAGTPLTSLALRAGTASFSGTHRLGTLAAIVGAGGFSFANGQTLSIGTIDGLSGINVGAATLGLQVSGGSLTQTAGAGIVAGTLTGSVSGAATLTDPANAIGTLGAFSANGLSLRNASGLIVTGPVSAGSGDLTLRLNTGSLALQGNVSAAGTVTLDVLAGSIGQSAGGITAATLTGQSAGGTSLNSATNAIGTLAGFVNSGSGGFSLVDSVALAISGDVDAGAGNLSITAPGISFAGRTLSAGTDISLDGQSGSVAGSTLVAGNSVTVAGATIDIGQANANVGALSLTANGGALTLGTGTAGTGATLTKTGGTGQLSFASLTAGGDATIDSATAITGTTLSSGGDATATAAAAANIATIGSTGDTQVTGGSIAIGTVTAGGALALSAATGPMALGTGTAGGGVTLAKAGATGDLSFDTVTAGNDATLTSATGITGATLSSDGDVSVTAASLADLGAVDAVGGIDVEGASLEIDTANASGALALSATAGSLTLGTGTAAGIATFAKAGITGTLSFASLTAGDDAAITSATGITGTDLTSQGDVTITAAGLASLGSIASAGGTNANAGSIQIGTIGTGGSLGLVTTAGAISLATVTAGTGADLSAAGEIAIATSLTAGDGASLHATGAVSAPLLRSTGGGIAVDAAGAVDLGTVEAAGSLGVAGATVEVDSAVATTGSIGIAASSGPLTVGTATSGGSGNFTTSGSARIGTATSGGDLYVAAAGEVTGLGGARANFTVNGAGHDVTVSAGSLALLGTVTAADSVNVTTAGTLDATTVTATGGALTLAANGGALTLGSGSAGTGATLTKAGVNGELQVTNLTSGTSGSGVRDIAVTSSTNARLGDVRAVGGSIAVTAAGDVTGLAAPTASIAPTLAIGSLDASGAIDIDAAGDARLGSVASAVGDLMVSAGGSVTGLAAPITNGGANLVADADVSVDAGGRAALGTVTGAAGSIDVAAGQISIDQAGAGQALDLAAGSGLSVTEAIASTADIRTSSGTIETAALTPAGGALAPAYGFADLLSTTGSVSVAAGGVAQLDEVSAGNSASVTGQAVTANAIVAQGGALNLTAAAGQLTLGTGSAGTTATLAKQGGTGSLALTGSLDAGGNTSISSSTDAALATVDAGGSLGVTVAGSATGGALAAGGNATVTAGQQIAFDSVTAGGGLTATAASIQLDSATAAGGALALTASSGQLTLGTGSAGGAASLVKQGTSGDLAVTELSATGNVSIDAAGTARLGSIASRSGGISIAAAGDLVGIGGVTGGAGAGPLAIDPDGVALAASGNVNIAAGGSADFTSVAGGGVTLGAASVEAGNVVATGALAVTASSGDLAVGTATAGTTASLTKQGATGSLAVTQSLTAAGNTTIASSTDAALASVTAGGNLGATATGSATGATLASGGAASITAGSQIQFDSVTAASGLTASAGSILLGTASTTGGALALTASSGQLTLANGGAGTTATLTKQGGTGTLSVTGTLTSGGNASFTSATGISLGTVNSSGGNIDATAATSFAAGTLGAGGSGRSLTVNAGALADIGTATAGGSIQLASDDIAIGTRMAAPVVTLVNRAGGNSTRLGDGAGGTGGYELTTAEVNRIASPDLTIDSAAQDVQIGALALTLDPGSTRLRIMTTGRVDVTGIVSAGAASSGSRTVQIGGAGDDGSAANSPRASVIRIAATPDGGGRLYMAGNGSSAQASGANLDLRGEKIAAGTDQDFLESIGLIPGGTPLSVERVATDFIGNPNSTLFGVRLVNLTYSAPMLLTANTLTVSYKDYALFQNTALGAAQPSGVAVNQLGGTGVLSLNGSGQDIFANAFALFGSINGQGSNQTALLGPTIVILNNVDRSNTRINGCLVQSGGGGCLVSSVTPVNLNVFDSGQADILSVADELAIDFDPIVGTNNESLFGGLSSLDAGAGIDDEEEKCPDGQTDCGPGRNQ